MFHIFLSSVAHKNEPRMGGSGIKGVVEVKRMNQVSLDDNELSRNTLQHPKMFSPKKVTEISVSKI